MLFLSILKATWNSFPTAFTKHIQMRLLEQFTTTEIKYGRNEEVNFAVKTENKQAQFQIVYSKGDKKQDQRKTKVRLWRYWASYHWN